jgi:hypothetical protein
VDVASLDGNSHNVSLYTDISAGKLFLLIHDWPVLIRDRMGFW